MVQQNYLPDAEADALLSGATFDTREGMLPLLDFEGDCTKVLVTLGEARGDQQNQGPLITLHWVLTNLKVHASRSPWTEPECVVRFSSRNLKEISPRSGLGIWCVSVNEIMGPNIPLKAGLLNKHIRVMRTGGHQSARLNNETKQWEDVEIEAFEVVQIDGNPGAILQTPVVPQTADTQQSQAQSQAQAATAPPVAAPPQVQAPQVASYDEQLAELINTCPLGEVERRMLTTPFVTAGPDMATLGTAGAMPVIARLMQSGLIEVYDDGGEQKYRRPVA